MKIGNLEVNFIDGTIKIDGEILKESALDLLECVCEGDTEIDSWLGISYKDSFLDINYFYQNTVEEDFEGITVYGTKKIVFGGEVFVDTNTHSAVEVSKVVIVKENYTKYISNVKTVTKIYSDSVYGQFWN